MTPLRFEAVYERRPLAPDRGAATAVRWGVRASFEPARGPREFPGRVTRPSAESQGRGRAQWTEPQGEIGPVLRYTKSAELIPLELLASSWTGFGKYLDIRT